MGYNPVSVIRYPFFGELFIQNPAQATAMNISPIANKSPYQIARVRMSDVRIMPPIVQLQLLSVSPTAFRQYFQDNLQNQDNSALGGSSD
jgi:hypothetical protein